MAALTIGQPKADEFTAQHVALAIPKAAPETSTESSTVGEAADSWDNELTHRGMRITFRDLRYVVRNRANKSEKLSILKGISGFYLPAEMAAVMGPSGSG